MENYIACKVEVPCVCVDFEGTKHYPFPDKNECL